VGLTDLLVLSFRRSSSIEPRPSQPASIDCANGHRGCDKHVMRELDDDCSIFMELDVEEVARSSEKKRLIANKTGAWNRKKKLYRQPWQQINQSRKPSRALLPWQRHMAVSPHPHHMIPSRFHEACLMRQRFTSTTNDSGNLRNRSPCEPFPVSAYDCADRAAVLDLPESE
jgi:hypothetical protein